MTEEKLIQGGKQIARVLKEEGVEYTFGVSGGHVMAFNVGAGSVGVKMVHCRHEQAGGYAADGYARASGKVGVCFGTAGPGMTNQVSAIAQAYWCKSPVVAFYGQHMTFEDGRAALQECFAEPVLRSLTKWVRRVVSPTAFAYWTKRAFRDAKAYPQGPCAIEFPADIIAIKTPPSAQMGFIDNSYPPPELPQAKPEVIEKAVRLMLSTEKTIIAGGEAIFWSHAEEELQEFVELTQIPVITRRVGRGAVPEDHPLAFSGRARGQILREAEVACTIGLTLGYLEGYGAWAKNAKLIQITESQSDIEFTAKTEMVIIANPKEALRQMIDCAKDLIKVSPPKREAWLKRVNDIKAKERKRMADVVEKVKNDKPIHSAWMAHEACAVLDRDATIILDALTGSAFITETFLAKHPGAVLDSGCWAGVGHGVGMGIGAQLARPGKQVLVMMGDGGMGLGGFDVETAVRVQAPVVYLLANNSAWMASMGAMHRKAMPTPGTQLWSPYAMVPTRYDQMFAAMGAYTERVEDPARLKPALERAFKSGKASVIDCVVDPNTPPPMMAGGSLEVSKAGPMMSFWDPDDLLPDELKPLMFPEVFKPAQKT